MTNNSYRQIDIDPGALLHNLDFIKQQVGDEVKLMACIKGNAYGHGIEIAQALDGKVDAFAVARAKEAEAVSQVGIQSEIVQMGFGCGVAEIEVAAQRGITLVIYHPQQITWLAAVKTPINVWLKFDSGMHRLGLPLDDLVDCVAKVQAIPNVTVRGLMTHLASAEEATNPANQNQLGQFMQAAKGLSLPVSMLNSAGILNYPDYHADWVRPGGLVYGLLPNKTLWQQHQQQLKPVMTFSSKIIAIKTIVEGESVGYNATWTAQRISKIAVVAVGYADGYPAQAPTGTPVWIAGQQCPLVGRVSMDLITVDVTDCPEAEIGGQVELWGQHVSVHEVAEHVGCVAYVLTCAVGK